MPHRIHTPVTDDDIRLTTQDGSDELWDIVTRILAVSVGIDNDIGPQPQAGIQPGSKAAGQPAMAGKANDVVCTTLASHFRRPISAPVVYDQGLDLIDPIYTTGQSGQRSG